MRFKYLRDSEMSQITMDSTTYGFSFAVSDDIRINHFYINRGSKGTKMQSAFYISNCTNLILDYGSIKGAGKTNNLQYGRAININTTEYGDSRRAGNIIVSNVQIDSTGGRDY